jgi:hypothetical protein
MILAETNLKHRIEKLVLPLRDAFAVSGRSGLRCWRRSRCRSR